MLGSIVNIDLLWVGIAVAGAGTLGFSIYFASRKSVSARSFLLFCIFSIGWSITNFISVRLTNATEILWSIRLVLFFASWHAFSFFLLAKQFPKGELVLSRRLFNILLAWTALVSLWTLTPFVYTAVTATTPAVTTETSPGIVIFGLTVFMYIVLGIISLVQKFVKSKGATRHQMEFVLTGMSATFVLLITFDFIFPAFLNNSSLVEYGGLFLLPFIIATAYAMLRYRLFNSRIAILGLLVFLLATATFFDILASPTIELVVFRIVELIVILIAGIWLLRSVETEYELQVQLTATNERQEGLIHFIGHEVKGFLTKASGSFSELVEGDFGALPEDAKRLANEALAETRTGVISVSDILKAANQKRGTISYHFAPFNFKEIVEKQVAQEKPIAERKGLTLALSIDDGDYTYTGDSGELGDHVLRNLIENAINYTPTGSITVHLSRTESTIIVSVVDTGVGITKDDEPKLFTEGGHGKESQSVNVYSTGYGLYIAKNTVVAHGGTITEKSDGKGQGATFTVTLPFEHKP